LYAMSKRSVILVVLVLGLFGCESRKPAEGTRQRHPPSDQATADRNYDAAGKMKGKEMENIELTSPAFGEGEMIPAEYTADGRDVSPPLEWSGAGEGTKSYALINDDPDAPMGTWVHWVVYNLPADVTRLEENVLPEETLANGAHQGTTDFGRIGYGGPAPPSGTHRYFFKVYALDTMLDLPTGATKSQVESVMEGHILAEGQLMGKYCRR